ncbi:MAG: hypothetical protein ACQEQV_06510 [Fibrobacterota bacterium]
MIVNDLSSVKEISTCTLNDVLRGEDIDGVVVTELMSDVLTIDYDNILFITSLCSFQAITTADIIGAVGVIITSGKEISDEIRAMAVERKLALFTTDLRNFEISALLCRRFPELAREWV